MAKNLTQADFMIHILDPQKLLQNIFWESCTEIGMTADLIGTSNGRQRYQMTNKPTPKPITLSKAANPDEDKLVNQWVQNFCEADPIIPGMQTLGTVLNLVPLKPCMANEPYAQRIKVFNLIPTDWSLWNANILSTTDVSRTTVVCSWTHYTLD